MAQARTDYPHGQTVCGLMVELTSALVSMTQIQRTVTPDDIDHAREHVMAAMDLAKRLLRDQLGDVDRPIASADGLIRRSIEIAVPAENPRADDLAADALAAMREQGEIALVVARRAGLPLRIDVDPDISSDRGVG